LARAARADLPAVTHRLAAGLAAVPSGGRGGLRGSWRRNRCHPRSRRRPRATAASERADYGTGPRLVGGRRARVLALGLGGRVRAAVPLRAGPGGDRRCAAPPSPDSAVARLGGRDLP